MKQSHFDRQANGYFLTLEDGRTIFYPSGPIGRRGYVVDTPAREQQLRTAARRCAMASVVVVLGLSIPLGFVGTEGFLASGITLNQLAGLAVAALLVLALLGWLITVAYFRLYKRGLERVSIPNQTAKQFQRFGSTMNPTFVRLFKYYVIAFVVVCIVVGIVSFNMFALLLGACMIPTAVFYSYMDRARTAPAEHDGDSSA